MTRKDPYAFSIQVSDILRQYVSAQYHLHATEQTSPEFLADAAKSPHFTGADKQLLADFLEHCDLIKFARWMRRRRIARRCWSRRCVL